MAEYELSASSSATTDRFLKHTNGTSYCNINSDKSYWQMTTNIWAYLLLQEGQMVENKTKNQMMVSGEVEGKGSLKTESQSQKDAINVDNVADFKLIAKKIIEEQLTNIRLFVDMQIVGKLSCDDQTDEDNGKYDNAEEFEPESALSPEE
ncbi:hypothetical protein C8R48DRAFT_672201 [Suillus tomentosus]|nr:hypothetical protein C8R48DRAFT_672201 [Suillus tomentosus]